MLKNLGEKIKNKRLPIRYHLTTIPVIILSMNMPNAVNLREYFSNLPSIMEQTKKNIERSKLGEQIKNVIEEKSKKTLEKIITVYDGVEENFSDIKEKVGGMISKPQRDRELTTQDKPSLKIQDKKVETLKIPEYQNLEDKIKIKDLENVPYGLIFGRAKYFDTFLREEGKKIGLGEYFFHGRTAAESRFINDEISKDWAITAFQLTEKGVDGLNEKIEEILEDKLNKRSKRYKYVTLPFKQKLEELNLKEQIKWQELPEDPDKAARVMVAIDNFNLFDLAFFLSTQNSLNPEYYIRDFDDYILFPYKVKEGGTLQEISTKYKIYDVSVESLLKFNQINPRELRAGRVLNLPIKKREFIASLLDIYYIAGPRVKKIYGKYGIDFIDHIGTRTYIRKCKRLREEFKTRGEEDMDRIEGLIEPKRYELYIRNHEFKRGDTIYQIANKYGALDYEINKVNKIENPNKIPEGKLLRIPVKKYK